MCCVSNANFYLGILRSFIFMTDKELRKLSRLELLELLLEVSKENRKLKERIGQLKTENKTAQNIENLYAATRQVENALKYVNSLIATLENTSGDAASLADFKKYELQTENSKSVHKTDCIEDKDIYIQMLCFFAKNDDKLDILPDDISANVKARINELLKGVKTI